MFEKLKAIYTLIVDFLNLLKLFYEKKPTSIETTTSISDKNPVIKKEYTGDKTDVRYWAKPENQN